MLALLVGLSIAVFSRVWLTGDPARTVMCPCGDTGQAVWFMAWVPYALGHLQNPLFTNRLFAGQGGADLLASTSYLLPSFLLSPVTALFGATASFNVAETAAPVLSGWAMYLASGRLSSRWVPRAAGGLLYGFSPFLVQAETQGHLNQSWLFFPPLLFLALHEILVGRRRSTVVAGSLLGVLVAAEYFTGAEPLAMTVLGASAGLLVALVLAPRAAFARRKRILVAFGTGVGVSAVLLAYPVWFMLRGPRHVVGPPWPAIGLYGNSPWTSVRAGDHTHAGSAFARLIGYFGATGPPPSYLGIGLVVVIGISLPLFVLLKRKVAWSILVAGLICWVFSFGVLLLPFSSHSAQWWLLWRYLDRVPVLADITPGRFALVTLSAACLLAVLALDCFATVVAGGFRQLPRYRANRGALGTLAGALTTVGLAAVACVPVAEQYSFPLVMHPGEIPAWFRTAARHLAPATTVLTYPYASSDVPDAMYWQAVDGLGFALVGGRALIPGADGRRSEHVDPLGGTNGLLYNDSFGTGLPRPPTPVQVRALRSSLRHWRVDLVVVVADGRAPGWAVAWFAEALGIVPTLSHRAAVFPVADAAAIPRLLPAAVIRRCDSEPASPAGLVATMRCLRPHFPRRP